VKDVLGDGKQYFVSILTTEKRRNLECHSEEKMKAVINILAVNFYTVIIKQKVKSGVREK